jgi:hypothetical protein
MNLESIKLFEGEKKPVPKDYNMHDSFYVKCPEWASPQRQKMGSACLWCVRWRRVTTSPAGFLFGVMGTFWN